MKRLLLVLLVASCAKPAPPAPTVGLAESARPGVELVRDKFKAEPLSGSRRIEDGSELATPADGRASVRLDGGSWLLIDAKSRVRIQATQVTLLAGRIWVDARQAESLVVAVPGGTLSAAQAGFAVELNQKGASAYCVSGQLTYAAKTSNRLEEGMSVQIDGNGIVKEEPESRWDDWTGGLAEPGPPRALEPAGVGQLSARRSDEIGAARAPLILRRHDVRATIEGDRVVTDVEQVFFNPRSEAVEGVYTLRLPPGAILIAYDAREGDGDGNSMWATSPRAVAVDARGAAGQALEWASTDRYRGRIMQLQPGKTELVRVRYMEWLSRRGNRRTWTYAMGGANPPLLGEFSLEVDTDRAQAGGLEAGMGARIEAHKIVLRKSDFRPRADFALDLLDGKDAPKTHLYTEPAGPGDIGRGYVLTQIDPPFGPAPSSLQLVIVVDASAATDPGRLDLERAVVDAVLRQLTTRDKVAVMTASTEARPVGAAGLLPVDAARTEALLEGLARTAPGGATDLGTSLTQAAKLLPAGEGVVLYIGDGRPTLGALTPAALAETLAHLGTLPRIFTVGIGSDSDRGVLDSLGTGGIALTVEDRPDAAHAAYRILGAAAQPTLRDVKLDLGASIDVAYPQGPMTLAAGQPLTIVGRLRGTGGNPTRVVLTGLRDGKRFTEEVKLASATADTRGDLRRRWARGRLDSLLSRFAGREALVEVGTHFGLVTPFSALLPISGSMSAYIPIEAPQSSFRPDDATVGDGPIAFEAAQSRGGGGADVGPLYVSLLQQRDEGVRVCYDRKAASHPELSGRVELKVKIGLAGEVQAAQVSSSTLRDPEVEACMVRGIRAIRLPPPPDVKIHDIVADWTFEAEDSRLGAGRRCSQASTQYLATRRQLWRERLGSNPGVEGAMAVWREAGRACELKTWLDKKALLDLARRHVGPTLYQVDLYHRFNRAPDVQAYLRREILRAVRTAADVAAVRGGLSLDGGLAPELMESLIKKQTDLVTKIKVVRTFLALAPEAIGPRLRLLGFLVDAAKAKRAELPEAATEARRVADSLRADPGADADTREAVGELLVLLDPDEGARAFTEIVEFAPYDPWARRRLGDLLLAHARAEDAYREYQTLAWLMPSDPIGPLLLGRAAAAAGRTDEALRLEEKISEAVDAKAGSGDPANWARHLTSVMLAKLRDGARTSKNTDLLEQLGARTRQAGVLTWAKPVMLALTSNHPRANLQLSWAGPGDTVPRRASMQGGAVGIEADHLSSLRGPLKLQVRCVGCQDSLDWHGDLWVLLDEAKPTEQLLHLEVRRGGQRDFVLDGKQLK